MTNHTEGSELNVSVNRKVASKPASIHVRGIDKLVPDGRSLHGEDQNDQLSWVGG